MTDVKLPFDSGKGWEEKIIDADNVWAQVKAILSEAGLELPTTERRPDVRLILNNISGHTQIFSNPGKHSAEKKEEISSEGEKTAAMVMVQGADLEAQQANAAKLVERYDLGQKGLSDEFVAALEAGECSDLVKEAYGPAPFEGQASKIVDVKWRKKEGLALLVEPVKGEAAVYGARAATKEQVLHAHFPIFVQGTGTTAELVESMGMCIAVSEDWQTKQETTRPIVPSIAQDFYGAGYANIPMVTLTTDGYVQSVKLGSQIIAVEAPEEVANTVSSKPVVQGKPKLALSGV